MDSQRWPFAVFRPEIVQWSFNPIGSMVLLYMVLHGSHQYTPFIVSIYTSTMDPMGMIYPWFSCCSWFIDTDTSLPLLHLVLPCSFLWFSRNYPRNGDVPAIYPHRSCWFPHPTSRPAWNFPIPSARLFEVLLISPCSRLAPSKTLILWENHHVQWLNPRTKSPFSIANNISHYQIVIWGKKPPRSSLSGPARWRWASSSSASLAAGPLWTSSPCRAPCFWAPPGAQAPAALRLWWRWNIRILGKL